MSKLAAVKTETRIGRPLKVLVPLIQHELSAGDQAGLEHYRRAGEMLNEARAQVAAFKWNAWLKKNFALSDDMARRYMRYAELPEERRGAAATLTEALGEPSRDTRRFVGAWKPVGHITKHVDIDRLAQERQTIETEVRLHRELADELIVAGYRALATRLHPDQGGSKDAMRRLNRVRDELKSLASTRRFV